MAGCQQADFCAPSDRNFNDSARGAPRRVRQFARGESMNRLAGKVALVTGAARGLGAAQAQALAKEGARVVFGDLADEDGKKVEEAIRADGGDAHYFHFDVAIEADWITV